MCGVIDGVFFSHSILYISPILIWLFLNTCHDFLNCSFFVGTFIPISSLVDKCFLWFITFFLWMMSILIFKFVRRTPVNTISTHWLFSLPVWPYHCFDWVFLWWVSWSFTLTFTCQYLYMLSVLFLIDAIISVR